MYRLYILISAIVFSFFMSCSNTDEKQLSNTEETNIQSEKHTSQNHLLAEKETEELDALKQKEQAEQMAREAEAQKAKETAEKAAADLKAKQDKELADEKAKGLSDLEAKKLQEKQKKELAELQAKEEAAIKVKEEANRIAKEKADRLIREKANQLAKEKADRIAKEKAEKIAKETERIAKEKAEKIAKEEADKLAVEAAKKLVKEEIPHTESANSIIQKVDKNMSAKTQIVTSDMVIYGKRNNRTVSSKGYSEGTTKSFTEYLAPAREKGTKMLKLDDRLWIYSPSTDRTIQLSGHMLRQSVMGSDLSYEDMMEDRKLLDTYNAEVIGNESIDTRKVWKLELIAKVSDVAYHKRIIWVDQERYVPLKEELYAKSGQLLKKTTLSNVVKVDGRWFPKKMNYKDMLKSGKGTDFIVKDIQFNPAIPAHIFTKGALKK